MTIITTRTIIDQAAEWLEHELRCGAEPYSMIKTRAPYSPTTLRRAAAQLGVISVAQPAWPRSTTWQLPDD